MGDRIELRFVRSWEDGFGEKSTPASRTHDKDGKLHEKPHIMTSAVLYSHWQGSSMMSNALDYLAEVQAWNKKGGYNGPLSRYEPDAVMFDFCRWLVEKQIARGISPNPKGFIDGGWRLYTELGDPGDNGAHEIDLDSLYFDDTMPTLEEVM